MRRSTANFGGEVLHIEATRYPGKGNITLTGQIGNVMKESMQAALSLKRSRNGEGGATPADFRDTDIHVHVPAGAIPKGRAGGRGRDVHGALLSL